MNIVEHFPRNYSWELVEEPDTSSEPRYFYPGAKREGGGGGITIRIFPAYGAPWLATFQAGEGTMCGVYTTPDEEKVLVVSYGIGYLVSADDPRTWHQIPDDEIVEVYAILTRVLLVLHGRKQIMGYAAGGTGWEVSGRDWEEVEVAGVDDLRMDGMVTLSDGRTGTFRLDLRVIPPKAKFSFPLTRREKVSKGVCYAIFVCFVFLVVLCYAAPGEFDRLVEVVMYPFL